jgi:DUF1009 family protein
MQSTKDSKRDADLSPIGLIAGWGRFPIVVAEALKQQKVRLSCVALKDHADPDLQRLCDDFQWTAVSKIGQAIRFFRRCGVGEATMAGKVFKVRLFDKGAWRRFFPDWRTARIFWPHFVTAKRDRMDDTLLSAVVGAFEEDGIKIRPATDFAPELLVKFGKLTRLGPTHAQQRDIEFAWQLAKEMGRLDIGQSVVVKNRACLAVEAIEGTDQCIRRAGQLCPAGGFTVVKLAKPQQDMRFDVPTIGLGTLDAMIEAGAKMLVVEAGRTILMDEPQFIQHADRNKLIVVSLDAASGFSENAA